MKTFKRIVVVSIVATGMVSVTFAAWWNPLTWFKKKTRIAAPTISVVETNGSPSNNVKIQVKETASSSPSATLSHAPKKKTDTSTPAPEEKKVDVSPKPLMILGSASSLHVNKDVTLTIHNSTGGTIYSSVDNRPASCYSNESCKVTFSSGKTVNLNAQANPGYEFLTWSGTPCNTSQECALTLSEDTTIQALFGVIKTVKSSGRITVPAHPSSICYIQLGRSQCVSWISWITQFPQELTIDDNQESYVLKTDGTDAVVEGVPMKLFLGTHTISLKNRGEVLDSVKVEVMCVPGSTWDGRRCWNGDAKDLYIFKSEFGVVRSDVGKMECGVDYEDCITGYPKDSLVTLTISVKPGYVFGGWTGDCATAGKSLTCDINMSQERSVGFSVK